MKLRKRQRLDPGVNQLNHEGERKANLTDLPTEVLLMIFSLLSKSELVSISQTCHGLKQVARDPSLWTEIILKYEAIRQHTWACRNLIGRCTMLKHLTITSTRTDIDSAKVISVVMKRKDTLTYLKIDNDKGLHNSAMNELSRMTNIRHLVMGGERLESNGLSLLTNLTELQEFLMLTSPYTPRKTPVPITSIEHFASCMKNLRILKIPGLTVAQVAALVKNYPQLEQVGNWVFTWGRQRMKSC